MTDKQLDLLKCVADQTRLLIMHSLKKGELCVHDITNELGLGQSLVSHHLRALRKCGLVKFRRDGKKKKYRLANQSVSKFLADVEKISKKFC